jgi:hypothetical protein
MISPSRNQPSIRKVLLKYQPLNIEQLTLSAGRLLEPPLEYTLRRNMATRFFVAAYKSGRAIFYTLERIIELG